MTTGRKPKPSALKLVTGNPGRRRLPASEPKPKQSASSAPTFLSTDARTEWRRVMPMLVANGIMTGLDRAALAAYCQAYGRWAQAERALADDATADLKARFGLLSETSNGNKIQNPLVGIANKAARDMVRYASEFGMSPAARARVASEISGIPDGPEKTGAREFFG